MIQKSASLMKKRSSSLTVSKLPHKTIKISYVLVARNDNYCGDSVGRLTNSLNHLGEVLHEYNELDSSECVLVDWASPNRPLKDVLVLNDHIKKILKIVTVPTEVASKYQKNSPFSEVHAMNCGFRRMSGKYFARIDQDTLVGRRFVEWFYNEFDKADYGFRWPKVAFCSRRNLDEKQSPNYKSILKNKKNLKSIEICHDHNHYSRLIPNGNVFPFYGGAVGVMIVEKNLYEEEKGFNEEMIFMNNMDTEFLNRLGAKEPIYNLCLKIDADFYHQHHDRSDGASNDDSQPHAKQEGCRPTNSLDYRNKPHDNQNDKSWGLKNENLEVSKM